MTRREEMHEKFMNNKQKEIDTFLNNVNVLHNGIDNITIPSMQIMKECDNYYITYYIAKYPNCLKYSITRYKKDYPFQIYHSKEFYQREIPSQYKPTFTELEQYFI